MNSSDRGANEALGIREVWKHNLEEEFRHICWIIKKYNYVAMDTEFPGVVVKPPTIGPISDYQYQTVRCNVDVLKIIQLGLTVLDEYGNTPETGPTTWQFNFKFNLDEDTYAKKSVDLLLDSGILFDRHQTDGIETSDFAELMLMSGLVLVKEIKWLSFSSGFDFGFLLNILTNQKLPATEAEFFKLLKLYFPNTYDIKHMMKYCQKLKGGLQDVAKALGIPRVGTQHQAGSDALTTGLTFFKIKEMYAKNEIDFSDQCGQLFGLNNKTTANDEFSDSMSESSSTEDSTLNISSASSMSALDAFIESPFFETGLVND